MVVIVLLAAPAAVPVSTPSASIEPSGDVAPPAFAAATRGYGVLDPFVAWIRGFVSPSEELRGNAARPDPAGERAVAAEPRRSGLRRVIADVWRILIELLRQVGLIAPFYSRLVKARALDHEARQRLVQAVGHRPGVPLSEIARETNLPYKTAAYHSRRLSSVGLLTLERDGKFLRAWPNPHSRHEPALHGAKRGITDLLRDGVARTRGEIASALGITPQGVGLHLTELVSAGVVQREHATSRTGRTRYWLAA